MFWFSGFWCTINTEDVGRMLIMVYSVTEAETIEGLFDISGLRTFISADVADFAARDVLLELRFAEDHSVLALLSDRTRQ